MLEILLLVSVPLPYRNQSSSRTVPCPVDSPTRSHHCLGLWFLTSSNKKRSSSRLSWLLFIHFLELSQCYWLQHFYIWTLHNIKQYITHAYVYVSCTLTLNTLTAASPMKWFCSKHCLYIILASKSSNCWKSEYFLLWFLKLQLASKICKNLYILQCVELKLL